MPGVLSDLLNNLVKNNTNNSGSLTDQRAQSKPAATVPRRLSEKESETYFWIM